MIIRTHVDISTLTSASKKAEAKSDAIVEEVKPIRNEEIVLKRKNNKKNISTPVVEQTPVVEEDKIDLSEWLKDEE
jgi:hypothetical protein